jgi:geranylgeranyl pyrophosphate synthase
MNLHVLKESLDQLNLEMTSLTKSNLTQELNRLVEAGGKKFRPGLLFLMGEVFDFSPQDLRTYARSVELTHLASLIHDDVIDESPTRRNHPTLNSTRNNTTSILAGDFVLATVMGELSVMNQNEILRDLTVSIQDLADGEWLQYELKRKEVVTTADLDLIAIKKTGSLIRWCCTTPAKLGSYKNIESMATLGERVGLIFQMADDIVDGLNISGRPPFQDITNGQFNFVTLKLMELFPEITQDLYAFKKSPKDILPWTTTQYNEAIRAVDSVINFERDRVLSIFEALCTEKNKKDLIPLFEMMIRKIQSNYSSFFENLSHG